jgi:hypothetical protein
MKLQRSQIKAGIAVGCTVAFVILWALYFLNSGWPEAPGVPARALYLFTGLILALAGARALLRLRGATSRHFVALLPSALCGLLLSAAIFSWISPDYRVLQDEAVLTSTSFLMADRGQALAAQLAEPKHGGFEPLTTVLDKRPPLFAFLVHLLHRARGYSVSHPFAVNFLILFLFLTLLHSWILRSWGRAPALAGALLVAGHPAVFIYATSAGFDLLSAFLFFFSLLLASRALREPSPARLTDLILGLALFSSTRYESGAVAALILALTLATVKRKQAADWLRESQAWLAPLAVLLTPLAWLLLNLPAKGQFEHDLSSLIGPGYILEHLLELPGAFFFPRAPIPPLQAFYLLAIISGLALLIAPSLRRWLISQKKFLFAAAPAVLLITSVSLALFWGSFHHPDAWRYFLVFFTCLALLPAIALGILVNGKKGDRDQSRQNRIGWAGVSVAAALFLFHTLVAQPSRVFSDTGGTRAYREARDFLASRPAASTLVISDAPVNYAILGLYSFDFPNAEKNLERIRESLRSGELKEALVLQFVNKDTGATIGELKGAKLETLAQTEVSSRNYLRISKVVP